MNRNRKPVVILISFFFRGCCGPQCEFEREMNAHNGDGGGTDIITSDLPFQAGYESRCVQGAGGSYSHTYLSTEFDLDLDTPNTKNDLVFAPMDGTAYVHDDGSHGFGRHVNLDLHDGTYLLVGHLKDVFIQDGTDVAAGEMLGFEGTTGSSTGDHVHFGRHSGNAKRSAGEGSSLQGLKIKAIDLASGDDAEVSTTDAVCSLSGGHVYQSELPTAHWHPVGTLLKTPYGSTVYRVAPGGGLQRFMNEDAFTSRGYNFRDVVLASPEEISCYTSLVSVDSHGRVRALRDSANNGWILLGASDDPGRVRLSVNATGASGVLASYGIRASSFDDIDHGDDADIRAYPSAGTAKYADGALLSEEGKTDVYVMTSGIAMPIQDWNTYLLMGFVDRDIIRVTAEEMSMNVAGKGSCNSDLYCVTKPDVAECGHSEEVSDEQQSTEDSGQYLPEGEDSGDGQDSAVAGEAFTLRWETPGGLTADWITVAGTWTLSSGEVITWDPMLAGAHSTNTVTYGREVQRGDVFHVSVAYGLGSAESWSCLAPFPPGTVRGTVDVRLDAVTIPFHTIPDPNSAGCQIEIVIP